MMNRLFGKTLLALISLAIALSANPASAASIFLTGHDPDFHASTPNGLAVDSQGAVNINNAAIDFIMNPTFNLSVAGGATTFLFVESSTSPTPGGHRIGKNGIIQSGYAEGVDFVHADASTLDAELDKLGTTYGGLVIASDFGGLLAQAELNILNTRSADIIDFLNTDNGGLYAMAEGNSGSGLTPGGGHFGFLPFVVSTTGLNQSEVGTTVTAFGASLGLTDADVSDNFSHNIFNDSFGLNIVDLDSAGNILSLAGRGVVDPGTGVSPVPVPAAVWLFGSGLVGLIGFARRGKTT
jgi:hypothetical protein